MSQKQQASPLKLPARPNIEYLKKAAKSRLKELQQADPAARLAQAQFFIARDYGFKSWRVLQKHIMADHLQSAMPASQEKTAAELLYDQALPRQQVEIDLSLLDRYAGDYQVSQNFIFSVTKQNQQLFVKPTGQSALAWYPESETKFFSKAVHAQISFVEEQELHATALILHQNGKERRALRVAPQIAEDAASWLARRIKEGTAIPGSESALRRQIDTMVRNDGAAEFPEMTSELAEITRPQIPSIHALFAEMGKLLSIEFIAVGPQGWDVYRAAFENGVLVCRIFLNQEGKVAGLLLGGGP